MDIRDIIKELEMDGDANEALGFENVLLILNKEDPDILDVMKDMPSLPKLLRTVHKQGFWHGAEFGRNIFLNIIEDERKKEILELEDWDEADLASNRCPTS